MVLIMFDIFTLCAFGLQKKIFDLNWVTEYCDICLWMIKEKIYLIYYTDIPNHSEFFETCTESYLSNLNNMNIM